MPATVTQNNTNIPNPAYILWSSQDQLIPNSIVRSLSPTIISFITRAKTSQEAWKIISNTYFKPSQGCIKQVRSHLKNSMKGSQNITNFFTQ
jgi:hypothetical protein